jgi:thiamine kinase-like enzyme
MKSELADYLNNLLKIHYEPGSKINSIKQLNETRAFSVVYLISLSHNQKLDKLVLHLRQKPFQKEAESLAIEKARNNGVLVPKLIYCSQEKENPFEAFIKITKFIQGKQLSENSAWLKKNNRKFIESLSKIHKPEEGNPPVPDIKIIEKFKRDCSYFLKGKNLIDLDILNQHFDYVINLHPKISFQTGKTSLLQGDLHPTNILITENEDLCFLDWEHSEFGDYCKDLAYLKARTLDFMDINSIPLYNQLIEYYSEVFKDEAIEERMDYFLSTEYLGYIWRSCIPEITEKWLIFFFEKLNQNISV